MSLRRLSLAAVIALALLGASRPGSAQTDPTEPARRQEMLRLAREADGLYRDGYFRDALERFRKAYEAFPNPKLHFALGETCWELGQLVEALRHYEAYGRDVEEREQPHNWQRARERIVKLQAQTATLHVQANLLDAEVSVDGKVVGRTPLREPIRLMPGPHVVVVGKAGYEKQVIELTLKGGEMAARTVKLLTEEEAASGRRVFQQVEGQRRAAQEKLQRSQALQRKGLRLSGWTALAAGTALLATGGTFGILTQNEKSKVEGAATGTPWSDLQPHAHRFNTYRQLFYYCAGIGAGLAVSGGVLLALGYRRSLSVERAPEPRPRASPRCPPSARSTPAWFWPGASDAPGRGARAHRCSAAAAGYCADGVRDPCGEEQCDGADLGGQTCGSLGFYGGTPSCLANCCLSLADCQGTCGDGYDGAVSGYTLELVCAKQ